MSLPPEAIAIVSGQAVAFFAFDIGYEVDLDRLGQLLPVQPIQPISRTKQTPTYLQYSKPPRIISLGETAVLPGAPGQVQATIFDFGAVSISFRWQLAENDLASPLEKLPAQSKALFDSPLEEEAWRHVNALVERIKPAISRPALSSLIEDYYVFVIERTARPVVASELIEHHLATLAQILRFEAEALSDDQQQDALSKTISYYQSDLVAIDWNAALIVDADFTDTLSVLELMNVELLEARYIDAELDKRIEVYQDLAKEPPNWSLPFFNPYRQTIRELAELRIEAALLSERVENALKLIGDLYLARIHTAAGERFSLGTWDEAISRKLEIIGNLYQLLTDRISTTQAQTLELIIIILILIEIFLK